MVSSWDVFYYQPIDEFYYNIPAIHYFFDDYYRNVNLSRPPYTMLFGGGIHNLISIIFFNIFGVNIYALRLVSLFFSTLVLLILFNILNRCVKNKFICLSLIAYVCSDLNFLTASIMSELSISRAFVILISYWILYKFNFNNNKYLYFSIGSILSLLVLFSYLTNIFILLGAALSIFVINKSFHRLFCYLSGVVAGIFIFAFVNYYFYSTDFLKEFKFLFDVLGVRVVDPNAHDLLYRVKHNFFNLFDANFFRFNLFFLVLFLFCLLCFPFVVIKNKSKDKIILLFFILSFILQCVFINDFPHRKLIVIFPLFILMIAYVADWVLHSFNSKEKTFCTVKVVAIFFAVVLCVWYLFNNDYYMSVNSIWVYLVSIIIFVVFLLLFLNKSIIYIKLALVLIFVIPNLYGWVHFLNYEQRYKNSFDIVKKYEDNGVFVGGFSYAFSSYDNIPPLVNIYRYGNGREEYLNDICETIYQYQANYNVYSIGVGHILPTYNDSRFDTEIMEKLKINEPSGNRDITIYKVSLHTPFCME